MDAVEIRILGPIEVRSGGNGRPLPGGHSRTVLATLALHFGEPVGRDRLIEATWEGRPPASAATQVQSMISGLRRLLPGDCIETVGDGYMLRSDRAVVDLVRFQSAVADARAAAHHGDGLRASRHFRDGLDCWRGDAFFGINSAYLAAHAARLDQLRSAVLEEWAGLELSLGRPGQVIDELSEQLAADPLRESTCSLLMCALYQTGRQAEALAAFRSIRAALIETLGVEPGPGLQELHRRMLAADPELLPSPSPANAPVTGDRRLPAGVPLAQVPPDVADFTGRESVVKELADLLCAPRPAASGAPIACLLTGAPGVGKTALAIHVAHLVRECFPDGLLYVDMHATSERPVTTAQVMTRILRDLGIRAEDIPADEDERIALYRSAVAYRRVLIVLDDARDGSHVRTLLPASGTSAVLVTSRNRGFSLPALTRQHLGVLDRAEAMLLFDRIVGAGRVPAEPAAAEDILAACGYLPLALRIAACRLASRPQWTVETLAGRLGEAAHRLDELTIDGQETRSAFEVSYHALADDQARAFRMLAVSAIGEITRTAAAALLDLEETTVDRLAEALVDANLLELVEPHRYRYHDLARLFAREKAALVESAAERAQALDRLLALYHDSTQAAALARARTWLDREYRNVVVTVIQCSRVDHVDVSRVADVLDQVAWYLDEQGHWSCWYSAAIAVRDRAARQGDRRAEQLTRRHLASLATLTDRTGTVHVDSCPAPVTVPS
jgi:DNA-binding SARP family transcriptional activator